LCFYRSKPDPVKQLKIQNLVKRKLITIAILLTTCILQTAAQEGPSTFEFTENKGQWEQPITFRGTLPAGNFYLHTNGFTVVQHNTDDLMRFYHGHHGQGHAGSQTGSGPGAPPKAASARAATVVPTASDIAIHSHAYKVQFTGGAANPEIIPDKVVPGYNNYIIGNDPSKWSSYVQSYQALLYKNVYPNIDVRYYSENNRLKYDLIVHPGGNVNDILMKYEGVNKLLIKNKELIIKTSVGDVKELYPYSYQFDKAKGKQEIACSYELVDNNTVRFKVKGHTSTSTLIIDPTLIFSSFTGSRANQYGFTATPGPDGSLFSGGIVFESGFPVSTGAYQTTHKPGGHRKVDIGILKFSPNGTQKIYATYLGGSADDMPHSLFSDPQGNLVIMGRTYSTTDYPGTLIGDGGGCDIIVSKLNATGTALIGSLRIGGKELDGVNIEDQLESGTYRISSLLRNYGDDSHSEVILDAAGNIYVAAQTQSFQFPIRGSGFQNALAGGQDGVVMKIDPNCSNVIWSTYLGGGADDAAFVLALHPATNEIYVAGGTASNDFPGDKTGVYQGAINGGSGDIDGFVAVIANDGSSVNRSTYMGTDRVDLVYGIQFDRNHYPYIMGVTRGVWQPVNAAFSNPGSKQFIAKLQKDLSGFVYTTVFGSGSAQPNISPVAFLVDRCENVYISGWGGWITPATGTQPDPYQLAGTAGMPVTTDAIKSTTDNRDFYFIVIEKNAASLLYGTFFGQDGGYGEHVDGGTSRYDAEGVIYQAICANCYGSAQYTVTRPYPITPGVIGPSNGTGNGGCNLSAVKIAFNFAGVGSGPRAYFNGVLDTVGCVPFTITFKDTIRNAKTYEWNFGDGTPDVITSNFEVSHTYTAVNTYQLRLIAVDSTTCNIRDTAYLTIRVRDDKANLAMNITKQPPCESLLYQYDNNTTFPPGKPFKDSSFTWDFGDGTRITPASLSIQHSYAAAGTYKVRLILIDTNYCNSPDSIEQELRVSPLVDARFETPAAGCIPHTAVFDNTSLAGQDFFWDFGDGSTSTEVNPIHQYSDTGTYRVKLIVIDSNTCNIIDSTEMNITVHPVPVADFSFSPIPPQMNTPTIFTNLSTGAVRYTWYFGDGDSTVKNNADTVSHQYNVTGTFNACLVAYNQFDCTDTICKPVEALISPLLDVPNAFTPGRFGRNGVVTIAGFGIVKLTWRIYNRWGQVVFETRDRKIGWDGTYKGQLQPMDVYAYVLDAEFFDGKKVRKTGDITLIR
jgi:gliding motility-associated-like protein